MGVHGQRDRALPHGLVQRRVVLGEFLAHLAHRVRALAAERVAVEHVGDPGGRLDRDGEEAGSGIGGRVWFVVAVPRCHSFKFIVEVPC
nr:hypothetical protein GCM10020241_65600 [Streptoalloteichus tenebrarius]